MHGNEVNTAHHWLEAVTAAVIMTTGAITLDAGVAPTADFVTSERKSGPKLLLATA